MEVNAGPKASHLNFIDDISRPFILVGHCWSIILGGRAYLIARDLILDMFFRGPEKRASGMLLHASMVHNGDWEK